MSNDLFKSVNFTAGQEVRAVDLANTQKFLMSRLSDQIFDQLTPGDLTASGFPDMRGDIGSDSATKWAYALSVGGASPQIGGTGTDKKITISAGTLFQKIANMNGNESTLLPYTFLGTETVTLADGHATLPRVDLIQMKLEWDTGDTESRVFNTDALYATLDLSVPGTLLNTVVRARVKGLSGDHIQIRTESTGSLTYAEVGNQITITYHTGVTTVTAVEALIASSANLIEVDVAGTGANVLVDPGDTFGYTSLAGGADTVLASQSLDMQRLVGMTLSVVTGTPASIGVFPAPTSGYVPIAAIVVHALFAAGSSFSYADAPAATHTATIFDLRMPLRVKRYTTLARNCIYDDAYWKLRKGKSYVSALANESNAINVGAAAASYNDTNSAGSNGSFVLASSTTTINFPVQVSVGMSIVGIAYSLHGDGAVDGTVSLSHYSNTTGAGTTLYTNTFTNAPASITNVNASFAAYPIADGDSLFATFVPNASNLEVFSVMIYWVPTPESGAPTTDLVIPYDGPLGRLVGLTVTSEKAGAITDTPATIAFVSAYDFVNAPVNLQEISDYAGDLFADTTAENRHGGLDILEDPTHCQSLTATGNGTFGPPVWTNGLRTIAPVGATSGVDKSMVVHISPHSSPDNVRLYKVTFFVAEGF